MRRGLRVEIDLYKIRKNTAFLVKQLNKRGITITGVTKGVSGDPAVAQSMLNGGITQLADARLSNIARLRLAGISCPITMIRTPLADQVSDVIKYCETSYNSDLEIIEKLGRVAVHQRQIHGVVLMLEMGDEREGLLPEFLPQTISAIKLLPGICFKGIATNFGCLNGIAPTNEQMLEFKELMTASEKVWGRPVNYHSSGGSSNLSWALLQQPTGRTSSLRLGESILLGLDPISQSPIEGLDQTAISLFAEVVESTPTDLSAASPKKSTGKCARLVLAIGHQDTDVKGLGFPNGIRLIGASSDHMVVHSQNQAHKPGSDIRFSVNYAALTRAMAAPDVMTHTFDSKIKKIVYELN